MGFLNKKCKTIKRWLAMFLSVVMVLSNLSAEQVFAEGTAAGDGKTYILDPGELEDVTNSEADITAGTDNYFTIKSQSHVSIDGSNKTFTIGDTEVTTTKRIKFGGDGSVSDRSIAFTVAEGATAEITVCVMTSNNDNNAQIHLLASDGSEVAGTSKAVETNTSNVVIWSDIPAGSYYIAGYKPLKTESNCNIHYVSVTEKTESSDEPTEDPTEETIEYTSFYDFCDGSIIPNDVSLNGTATVTSADGKLTVACGPTNGYGYNGAQHGSILKPGNTITISVLGKAEIAIGGCEYSNATATVTLSKDGTEIETKDTKTTQCYHNDNTSVISFSYDGGAGDLVLTFEGGTTYVPNITVVRTEPKPDRTEVTATVTINDNGLLGSGDTITLEKEGANPIDITGADGKEVVLDINSSYKVVCSNEDVKVTAGGKDTVTTTTVDLTVAVDVVSTVVNPKVILDDKDGILGSAALTLTNNADETEVHTLTDGGNVKLKIGSTYKLVCSSGTVDAKINGSALLNVSEGLAEITVAISAPDTTHHTYDVWDFGAEQLEDTDLITYNNKLNADIINAWFPGVAPGTKAIAIPGDLTSEDADGNLEFIFNANGKVNHRLRTTNTALTRYDDKSLTDAEDSNTVYTGYLYSNSSQTDAVNVQLAVKSGDIVTFAVSSNGGKSNITWKSPSGAKDVQLFSSDSSKAQKMTFYAAEDGMYTLYSADEKLVVARIYRERPTEVTVSGSVTAPSGADLSNAKLVFTNSTTGVKTEALITDGAYSVNLSEQYEYKLSLEGVNGCIVDENNTLVLNNGAGNTTFPVNLIQVDMVTVKGSLADLPSEAAERLTLIFTSDNVFVPEYEINTTDSTYTAVFEKGVSYKVEAANVDDYTLDTTTVKADANESTVDLKFTKKPTYAVNVALTGPSAAEAEAVKLTFTLLDEEYEPTVYVYTYTGTAGIELRDGQYRVTAELEGYTQQVTADVQIKGAAVNKTIVMKSNDEKPEPVAYKETILVGTTGDYKTINEALEAVRNMTRTDDQRVTISIEPGNYEEMLVVDVDNVTLKNASANPSIELKNKGVDIAEGAVRITSYYGHGYSYFSMGSDCKYDEELLEVNKENGYESFTNPGSGTTAGSYWNATVVINADGFVADGIIFENSFNQYISEKAANDVIVKQDSAKEGTAARASMEAGDVTVQQKAYVERAAALAIYDNKSDIVFENCKFIGRQDTLYGGKNSYVEFNECSIYGGTDYIFGGMVAIFNKCDLVFNTSEDNNDVGYITAAQQTSGRGYLMYQCHVTSTTPGVDTASEYTSKPGYFGRPWAANTSEVVFYETEIDAADSHWGGGSLIKAEGWNNSLSGESAGMCEYGTVEASGVDNSNSRVSWCTMLAEAVLNDGTAISFDAFRKAAPVEDYYDIDLTEGLKAGVNYDGGISVIEDMPYTNKGELIGGTQYPGYVAGSNNPLTDGASSAGSIPNTGAALKLVAVKDGKLKVAAKINADKTVYFVDADDTTKNQSYKNSGSSSELAVLSYDLEAGHTYYFYAGGSKIPLYGIVVDYREPEAWGTIAAPVLKTPVVNENGTITVSFTAMVGGLYSDSLEVSMLDGDGEVVSTVSYTAESESGSVDFVPEASGDYTFKAVLKRSGETDKESNTTEKVSFKLPLSAPVVINAESLGNGSVKFSWQAAKEAESYQVFLDGTLAGTSVGTSYIFEGLTVGKEYTFGVAAVRGTDVSEIAAVKQTVAGEAVKTWSYAAFGSGTDTKNNGSSGSVDEGNLSVWSTGGKGKLVPASTDGLAFYYTTIDPGKENFTLSADIEVDSWTYSNGQEGFGIMAADAVGIDGDSSTFWNNSYMASVTKVEYLWDSEKNEISDTGDKYTMKLGVGAQEKIGVTKENIANGDTIDYFSSIMTTLETSAVEKKLGAGTYNIVGKYTNDTDMGDIDPTKTTFHLTLQRNNTGYFLSYTDENGKVTTKKYYHGDDGDELTKLDEDNIYVGFFASRYAKINVKNVVFTTISPEQDAPAEGRPITYVTPNYTIESAATANVSAYKLVYYGNADGILTVKDDFGRTLIDAQHVTANTKIRKEATLAAGDNVFTVTFTPDADYQPSEYERLSSYETAEFTFRVNYKASALANLYISPNGTADGKGTKESPMDIYTAVKYAAPGQKLLLMEGTYILSKTVVIERGINGTEEEMIYLMADPEAGSRPVLDFNGACAGMILAGDYWYYQGFDVTNSANAEKGIQVSGSYNILDNLYTYRNGNTGIQISRYKTTDEWEDWPSYNLILNCTSYLNADAGYEDADGFAAKLTIADGNVFDGCIAAYNADDGWDLFAKVESGPIGKVVIRNSISFKNGYDLDADGNEIDAGNGNGFKMGGSSISGYHRLENSISFANKAKGIDSNSCPDIEVVNSISFNNESYNVAFYTNDAKNTDFSATGIISYKNANKVAEQIKLLGTQVESKVYGVTNYYFDGTASKNSAGATVQESWFVSLDADKAINGGITRNADGTINMNGFLELTSAAPSDAGARLSGTASKDVTVTPDEIVTDAKEVISDLADLVNGAMESLSDASMEEKIKAVAEALAILENADLSDVTGIDTADMERLFTVEEQIVALLETSVVIIPAESGVGVKNALLSIPAGRSGVIEVAGAEVPESVKAANAVAFTLDLSCGNKSCELSAPVSVSMKVPEGIDVSKPIVVYHFADGSTNGELLPVVVNGETGELEFITGGFSTFVIVNSENDGDENDGDKNDGDESDGDGNDGDGNDGDGNDGDGNDGDENDGDGNDGDENDGDGNDGDENDGSGIGLMLGEDGKWAYYNADGEVVTAITGLVPYDGSWFYVREGYLDTEANGFVEYDGAEFFVAGGQLQNVNGLVEDNGKFYFAAGGQKQSKFTGFAEYDGEWFVLVNGILDHTYNGFYDYNGATFVIAEGRMLSEYSGLYLASDNSWYYIAEGRLLSEYVGLALYDDAWFYIANGMLTVDFTGWVDYDGSRFYVVNGMLRP